MLTTMRPVSSRNDHEGSDRWDHLFEGDHIANQKDKVGKVAKGRQAIVILQGFRVGFGPITSQRVLRLVNPWQSANRATSGVFFH